jgi:Cu/Ag efflux protein CusF
MKYAFNNSLFVLLLAASGAVIAQEQGHAVNHGAMTGMQAGQPMTAHANTGVGVVNHVDLQHNKINLTHGPIASLGWPGMTMGFTVKDQSLLNGIKPGQKVEFDLVKEGPGQFFVVRIAPSK